MSASFDREKSAALGDLLQGARRAKGWSLDRTEEEASTMLRLLVESPDLSAHERSVAGRLARDGGVTRYHIANFEDLPRHPLTPVERRIRLMALVLALGVDVAKVNRLAGGL